MTACEGSSACARDCRTETPTGAFDAAFDQAEADYQVARERLGISRAQLARSADLLAEVEVTFVAAPLGKSSGDFGWDVGSPGDVDGDGYGLTADSQSACAQPSGYVLIDGDCDDGVTLINPDASEVCDGVDNDCDGAVDDSSAADALTWYTDADGDGFGSSYSTVTSCSQPSGTVAVGEDCDDTNPAVNPAAVEVYYDGVDANCDGIDGDLDDAVFLSPASGSDNGAGLSPSTATISATMGKFIAATACSDIQKAMKAFIRNIESRSFRGLPPKRRKQTRLMRVERPDFIRQAASMKAPRMKKTAELPK